MKKLTILLLITLILFTSCDLIKSGLSSVQEEELGVAIGEALLSSDVWYYNGSLSTDISESQTENIKITFTKKVKIDDDGLKGNFIVNYTDYSGNQTTRTLALNGGELDDPGLNFVLDLSPLVSLFNGEEIPSGTADINIELSGFITDEGEEKGRLLPSLKEKITATPLFVNSVEETLFLSSKYSTNGAFILIPVNDDITLTPDASVDITGDDPERLTSDDLNISIDGKNLKITTNAELQGDTFDTELTITGILTSSCGTPLTRSFNLSVLPSLIKLDGVLDSNWTADSAVYITEDEIDTVNSGTEADGLYVTSDADSLYLGLSTPDLSNFWDNDEIGFYIDIVGNETGYTDLNSFADWLRPATSFSFSGGTADIVLLHRPKDSGLLLYVDGTSYEESWDDTPENIELSELTWVNPNGPTFLEYKIDISALGIEDGDSIRVFSTLTNKWSDSEIYASDIIPGTTPEDGLNITINFDNGLTYTHSETGGTLVTPQAVDNLTATADTNSIISLNWESSYSATSYDIYRSLSSGGTNELIASDNTSTSYTDNSLEEETTYYYTVVAKNSAGASDESEEVSATTLGSITISLSNITTSSIDIILSEDYETNTGTTVEGYRVLKSDTLDGTYSEVTTLDSTTFSYTDTGLTSNTNNYYKVEVIVSSVVDKITDVVSGTTLTEIVLDGILEDDWVNSGAVTITDASDDGRSGGGVEGTSLSITDDGTNLYIAMEFTDLSGFWNNDRVVIMIDKADETSGYTSGTMDGWQLAATSFNMTNGEADIYLFHNPGQNSSVLHIDGSVSEEAWNGTPTTWSTSSHAFYNPDGPSVLEYQFPLSELGLESGDNIRTYAVLTNYWSDTQLPVADLLPGSTPADNENITVDFDNGLGYSIK